MKKSRIFGYALTLAATLVVGGAMGQATKTYVDNAFSTGKYLKFDDEPDEYVTVGTTTGYYATPDPAYHPGWNAGTKSWVITDGTVWNWDATVAAGTAPTKNYPVSGKPVNYVEFTWNSVGDHTLKVSETLPAAFGTGACLTSDVVSKTVKVIAVPTVEITTTYPTGQTSFLFCSADAALATQKFDVKFTESAPNALDKYMVNFSIQKDEYSSATGSWANGPANEQATKLLFTAKTGTVNVPAMSLTAGSQRTRYTIKLTYLSSTVTRKGDFAGNTDFAGNDDANLITRTWKNFFAHDAARPDELVYIVNAKPVTGPVYHISNNFAK